MPRILSIGHSYVVALNRRLPHEMARVGAPRWEVVAVAPKFIHGDLRPISLEPFSSEANGLQPVASYLTRWPHVMFYGQKLKALLREPWEIVHCWEEPYVLAGVQLARWASRSRFVPYTFQNIAKTYLPPFNWIERYTIARSAGWVAAGQTVSQTLDHRQGYARKPHRVITLGVDTEMFSPGPATGAAIRRQLGWAENGAPVVGYLGRFIPQKGLGLLMRALAGVRTEWRALFVGGGPMEAELRNWGAEFPDRVRVVTGIPHDGVPAHLNAMDLLAAPSQTGRKWREQLGRMLIEAFACGIPVIGSDSGEIPYVLAACGKVVGEADVVGWTASLGELIDSPSRRQELARAGLDRASSEFAWPVIAQRHLDFFGELLDTRQADATHAAS
jgi:glycosyltransferase involved in cell wall biosynthesis